MLMRVILEDEDDEPMNNNDCFRNALSNPLPVNFDMEIETNFGRLAVSQIFIEFEANKE